MTKTGLWAMPANVWLLTGIQALAMCAGTMMVLVGGLAGSQLAPVADMATLPLAMMVVGTAVGVIPATRLMGRFSRKPVFVGGALLAVLASCLAAYATANGHFYLFLLSASLLGMAVSVFQQIRFAAMESVTPEHMPQAASTILLGGLAAAFVGPELVMWGRLVNPHSFAGTFLLMAGVASVCAVLFMFYQAKAGTQHDPQAPQRSISKVVTQPLFLIAVSSSVVGYALMTFVMTATPVHMNILENHSLEQTKWVIQSHILAMFLPSFFSGWLINRIGVRNVIIAGVCAYLLTIMSALSGNAVENYWLALVLLGVGWNFLFLSGTVLLPKTHQPEQKFKVQSLHEFMVFSVQALASLGAGFMLYQLGWHGLLYVSLGIIALYAAIVIWQVIRMKVVAANETA